MFDLMVLARHRIHTEAFLYQLGGVCQVYRIQRMGPATPPQSQTGSQQNSDLRRRERIKQKGEVNNRLRAI